MSIPLVLNPEAQRLPSNPLLKNYFPPTIQNGYFPLNVKTSDFFKGTAASGIKFSSVEREENRPLKRATKGLLEVLQKIHPHKLICSRFQNTFQSLPEALRCHGIDLQEEIGAGAFGKVYRAVHIAFKKEMAIKVMMSGRANAFQQENSTLIELNSTLLPKHQGSSHIVRRHFGFSVNLDQVGLCYVVGLKLILGRSLDQCLWLSPKNNFSFTTEKCILIAQQLLEALAFMRARKIIHGDFKPGNIMFDEDQNHVTLCDFGLAQRENALNKIYPITARFWRAPEVIIGSPYDCSADMFGFGCILFDLYTNNYLFPADQTDNQWKDNINHLNLIIESLGFPSEGFVKKGGLGKVFFNDGSSLPRYPKAEWATQPPEPWKEIEKAIEKARVLRGDSEAVADRFLSLIKETVCYENRILPAEALKHSLFNEVTQISIQQNLPFPLDGSPPRILFFKDQEKNIAFFSAVLDSATQCLHLPAKAEENYRLSVGKVFYKEVPITLSDCLTLKFNWAPNQRFPEMTAISSPQETEPGSVVPPLNIAIENPLKKIARFSLLNIAIENPLKKIARFSLRTEDGVCLISDFPLENSGFTLPCPPNTPCVLRLETWCSKQWSKIPKTIKRLVLDWTSSESGLPSLQYSLKKEIPPCSDDCKGDGTD